MPLAHLKSLITNFKERSLTTKLLIGSVVLALIAVFWFGQRNSRDGAFFRTVPVNRGDLLATISATGTVEPEEVVDVGTQVAGRIVSFGKDKNGKTVDYGSSVEAGTVLAQIDDALYAADVSTARAALAQTKANVQRAEADLGQLKARLFQAERDWARAKKLGPSDALSQADYDTALSAHEIAKANVNVGQAAVVQAKDAVAQAEAVLRKASQNLDYCTIRSPVQGVIIDRRVNIGQTVVASLNAPSLFLIAKDLKRLQVWASVNEADIGNIRPGQPVTFTIDAYPGITFQGEVGKVRLNATMTQNVVTYTVEINTDNSDAKLIPYLTANVKFMVAERKDVLLVPNAALRWIPQPDQVAPNSRPQPKKAKGGKGMAGDQEAKEESGRGTVWVLHGKYVQALQVRLGLSDGSMTEVQGAGLKEEVQVVVAEQQKEAGGPASSGSPFTPQLFKGKQ
ncbi:MAG: efflux RND transporter periplasmic adaptor subunit [Deltaproteobacteria bacterium]|nr:efflux RND transporter periplasmic adaptor subunit [Deltaproteobacteria bacterium]